LKRNEAKWKKKIVSLVSHRRETTKNAKVIKTKEAKGKQKLTENWK
jgi:hypothetical protein